MITLPFSLYWERYSGRQLPSAALLFGLGQNVSLSVAAPFVESLGFVQSEEIKDFSQFLHDALNIGGLKAAPLHGGDHIATAGSLVPGLGEQGCQLRITAHGPPPVSPVALPQPAQSQGGFAALPKESLYSGGPGLLQESCPPCHPVQPV